MTEKIKACLLKAGIATLPSSETAGPLENYGLDSLAVVLLVLEIEREFNIRIPLQWVNSDEFYSIQTIANLITRLEAP
jgi:acyl carrier protein